MKTRLNNRQHLVKVPDFHSNEYPVTTFYAVLG
jgi:hypothetical protein